MQLASSSDDYYEHTSLDLLVNQINEHVKIQEYAMMRKRSKRFKIDVLIKVYIKCDRDDEYKEKNHDHRNILSRLSECSFKCIAKLNDNVENAMKLKDWILLVKHFKHNHSFTKSKVSAVHRKEIMKESEVLREIEKKSCKESKSSMILKELRLNENFVFKSQNIWNEHVRLKAYTLRIYTSTQALMKHLIESEIWYINHAKRKNND